LVEAIAVIFSLRSFWGVLIIGCPVTNRETDSSQSNNDKQTGRYDLDQTISPPPIALGGSKKGTTDEVH
jgi:hypothetical protein